jgi:MFS family permease
MRTPHFWLLFLVYLCTGLGSFFVSLHQLAFAVDIGFDKLYAAEVLGMGAFLAVPGIVVTGTLSDYIGREWSAILAYGFSIIGVVFALFITSPEQHLLLWLHACFFGLTWGARGPAITAKTADLFPGRQLGTILGVITIGSGVGAAFGSWGAGWIYDLSGSYRVAFIASIVSYAAGIVAFWALRRPPALAPSPGFRTSASIAVLRPSSMLRIELSCISGARSPMMMSTAMRGMSPFSSRARVRRCASRVAAVMSRNSTISKPAAMRSARIASGVARKLVSRVVAQGTGK